MKQLTILITTLVLAYGFGISPLAAQDDSFRISQAQSGVIEIADDRANWGGPSKGTTHQHKPAYQAEKTITISESALQNATIARLRVYMSLQDLSFTNPEIKPNGLDESFELLVNGAVHVYRDDDTRFSGRATPGDPLTWSWTDFEIPLSQLHAGDNTFVFRKQGPKSDDYLYIGIDNSVPTRHSRVSFDGGKNWQSKSLNSIGSSGEYMVRLLLLEKAHSSSTEWDAQQRVSEHDILGYAARREVDDQTILQMELDSTQFDSRQDFSFSLRFSGAAPKIELSDELKRPIPVTPIITENRIECRLGPRHYAPALIRVLGGTSQSFSDVRFDYHLPVGTLQETPTIPTDMAPPISSPRGKASDRKPGVQIVHGDSSDQFILENATLSARFQSNPDLRLLSLRNEYADKDILAHPEQTHLFLIEKDSRRYGAEDWEVQKVEPLEARGVRVDLLLHDENLAATWTVTIDDRGLQFQLEFRNTGAEKQSWKTAFPHIAGLQVSDEAAEDYYLFPYYEGLISDKNTDLRSYYGGDSAWWQMVDLYSPKRGAGIALRCLDETGLYKGISFQKGRDGILLPQIQPTIGMDLMDAALGWEQALPPAHGSAMTFEYLSRERDAGQSFSPPSARLEMHSGDWKTAMREYSQWAHRVWDWRPVDGKLNEVWQFASIGWRPQTEARTQPAMYDGKEWRTDYFQGTAQAYELIGWWEWSDYAPWGVPLAEAEEKLGSKAYNRYRYAFTAVDPANGKRQYMFNRGDYDYHQSWGGKEGLRGYAEKLKANNLLATLYTDPLLVDASTKLAESAPQYAVMNPYWKDLYQVPLNPPGYAVPYLSWTMCVDTEWYQKFVVDQMSRIVRDTQVDGIRFDEFGIARRPGACFNPEHSHIFAEAGHNQTLQAEAMMCQNVQDAVQKIRPGFVLTAEFTGYDYLAASLDGALNYTLFNHNDSLLRPVPLSIFRFYFPEHKLYMLQTQPGPKPKQLAFWNAMGTFISHYEPPYLKVLQENAEAFHSENIELLIPTLLPRLYANRFQSGEKTVTLLYNARRFTVDGPVLRAESKTDYHYFDLLNQRELTPQEGAIDLRMEPDQTAAIAQLPRLLIIEKSDTKTQITLSKKIEKAELLLCDGDGSILWRSSTEKETIPLPSPLPEGSSVLKLFDRNNLLDALELP